MICNSGIFKLLVMYENLQFNQRELQIFKFKKLEQKNFDIYAWKIQYNHNYFKILLVIN